MYEDDAEEDNLATQQGFRILSAHSINPNKPAKGYGKNCLWICSEAGPHRYNVPGDSGVATAIRGHMSAKNIIYSSQNYVLYIGTFTFRRICHAEKH